MGRWTDATRRTYYHNRYGEEEGERRYRAWLHAHPEKAALVDEDGNFPKPEPRAEQQEGSLLDSVPQSRRPQTRKARATAAQQKQVYEGVAATIYAVDKFAANLSHTWEAERLNNEEIGALARATGDEILNSPRLLKWFLEAKDKSVHIAFAWTVTVVALPRLVNHGIVPRELFDMLQGEQPDGSADMESRRAYGSDRDDGEWQVSPYGPSAGDAQARTSAQVQGGLSAVHRRTAGSLAFRHEGSEAAPLGAAAAV